VNLVADLLSLVSKNRVAPLTKRLTNQITQEPVKLDAGMSGSRQAAARNVPVFIPK
jgi:hypothetical protein